MGQTKSTLDQIEDRIDKKYNQHPEPIVYKPLFSDTSNPDIIEWDERDEYLREHKHAEFVMVPKDHTNPLAWNLSTKRMYLLHTIIVFSLVLGFTLYYNRLDEDDKTLQAGNLTVMIASATLVFLALYFTFCWENLWLDRILYKPEMTKMLYDVEDRRPGTLAKAGQQIIDDSNRNYRKLVNTGERLRDKIDS